MFSSLWSTCNLHLFQKNFRFPWRLVCRGSLCRAVQPKEKPADILANMKVKDDNPECFCSICDASFNNLLMAQQWAESIKKQRTRVKLMDLHPQLAWALAQSLDFLPFWSCSWWEVKGWGGLTCETLAQPSSFWVIVSGQEGCGLCVGPCTFGWVT